MRQFIKEYATVYTENGFQYVLLPNGLKIPNIVSTRVTDDANSNMAFVEVGFHCNVCSNLDEALKNYGHDKIIFTSDGKLTIHEK